MNTELQELKAQLDANQARLNRAERRARLSGACALAALALTLLVNLRPAALAQSPGTTLASLVTRIKALEAKTAPLSVSNDPSGGTNTLLTITGVNVQIVNGTGGTGNINGLGNLLVGYNESRAGTSYGADARTGSHNIVVGSYNNYSSFGGLVVGAIDSASGIFSVATGFENQATSQYDVALGGESNVVGGNGLSVAVGGRSNALPTGDHAVVTGGQSNTASGEYSSVSGGEANTAGGQYASVSGGILNTATGYLASISGGQANSANGSASAIAGGNSNITGDPANPGTPASPNGSGVLAAVGGGNQNTATGGYASVSGGSGITQADVTGWSGGSYHTP